MTTRISIFQNISAIKYAIKKWRLTQNKYAFCDCELLVRNLKMAHSACSALKCIEVQEKA